MSVFFDHIRKIVITLAFIGLFLSNFYIYHVIHPEWVMASKAKQCLQKGKYYAAEKMYLTALQQGADLQYLIKPMRKVLLNTGDSLFVLLKSARQLRYKELQALANYYNDIEEFENSITIYELILQKYSRKPSFQLALAQLYMRVGNIQKALEEYKKILSVGQKYSIKREIAQTLVCLTDNKEAEQLLEQLHFHFSTPKSDKEIIKLAMRYEMVHRIKEAKRIYETCISKEKPSFKMLVACGDFCVRQQDLEQALTCYNKALKIKPNEEKLVIKLADLHFWLKDYKEALKEYSCLCIKHHDLDLFLRRIDVFIASKNFPMAMQLLNGKIKKDKKNIKLLTKRAEVLAKSGMALQAKEEFKKLLINHDSYQLKMMYADALQQWRDFAAAKQIYLKILRRNPSNNEVKFQLAWLLASTENFSQAEGLYNQLLLTDKDKRRALFERAVTKKLKNDYLGALKDVKLFLKKYPNDRQAVFLQGDLYYKMKKYEKAILTYKRNLDKNGKEAREKLLMVFFDTKQFVQANNILNQLPSNNEYSLFYRYQQRMPPTKKLSPYKITKLADIYLSYNHNQQAENLYKIALQKKYFFSQLFLD